MCRIYEAEGVKGDSHCSVFTTGLPRQLLLYLFLEDKLEELELVFEKQRDQLASQLQSLVSVVVLVIKLAGIV